MMVEAGSIHEAFAAERRADTRHPMQTQVRVQLGDWSALRGWSEDVSGGGMRLRLRRAVAPGDHLTVDLTLPNALQLVVDAVVCRVEAPNAAGEHAVGLRWSDTESEDYSLLRELLYESLT